MKSKKDGVPYIKRCLLSKVYIYLYLLIILLAGVSASDVLVWQGQYYTGTTFNTGTYEFNFTVYDNLTGGDACYSNTTTLTTGSWGEWRTEQYNVSISCNNISKDYFLNINISGVDQTPRRRLAVWDFLRKNVNETTIGILTANTGDFSRLLTPYQQTVTVAKSGGDFTTVQGAIDSITDAALNKQYTVLIYPGEYTESVVGSDYIGLRGIGERGTVKITGVTGPLYTFPDNGGDINDLRFSLVPTTIAQELIKIPSTAGADRKSIINCKLDWNSSSDIRGAIFNVDAGIAVIRDCEIGYTHTGSNAGVNTHRVFDIDGNASVDLLANKADINIGDIDDNVIFYDDGSALGGDTHILDNVIHITSNNASAYDGIVRCLNFLSIPGYVYSHGNTILMKSLETGGTGIGEYVRVNSAGGGGIVNSVANQVIIEGFATNYWSNADTGDLMVSHFDDIQAVDGITGAGSFTYASSLKDGNFSVSDTYYVGSTPGIAGNYSVGNCWIYLKGGIATSTNCTSF